MHPAPGHCPAASQIGEVEVITPLLAEPLHGQSTSPRRNAVAKASRSARRSSAEDGQLFGIYLEIAGSGIVVKLKGGVSVNPATGRLTTRSRKRRSCPSAN